MAIVVVEHVKRVLIAADTTTTLQMRTSPTNGVDTLIIRKEADGNLSYIINGAEADLTGVPQADANTLTDDFPSRDLYKPGKIYHVIVRADAEMTIELDTERTPKRVDPT
jgi:hypothetical protein